MKNVIFIILSLILYSCGNPLGQNVKGTLINEKFSPGDVPVVTPTPDTLLPESSETSNRRIKAGGLPMGSTRAIGSTISARLSVSTSNRNLEGDSIRAQTSIK